MNLSTNQIILEGRIIRDQSRNEDPKSAHDLLNWCENKKAKINGLEMRKRKAWELN